MTKSPEGLPNPEQNESARMLRDIIDATLEATKTKKPDTDGNLSFYIGLNDQELVYTKFNPTSQKIGRTILWLDFKPTYGLTVSTEIDEDCFFGIQADASQPIRRRYSSGNLLGRDGSLPDLFTVTRSIDKKETEALLQLAANPHLNLNKIRLATRLNAEERSLKVASETNAKIANKKLHEDLARIAKLRIR